MRDSWAQVKETTIKKCFKNCGFYQSQLSQCPISNVNDDDDDVDFSDDDLAPLLQLVPGVTTKDLVDMDEATSVCSSHPVQPYSILSDPELLQSDEEKEEEEQEEEEEEEEAEPVAPSSFKRANQDLEAIVALAMKYDSDKAVKMANSLKEELQKIKLHHSLNCKQTFIKDFFS